MNQHIKEAVERFQEKYNSFELCEIVCKKDHDRLIAFLTTELEALEKKVREELIKEMIAFRSPYLYDDYSLLYQHSQEIQKDYYEAMGKWLNTQLEKVKKEQV